MREQFNSIKDHLRRNQQFFLFLLLSVIFFNVFTLSGNYYHMPKDGLKDYVLIFMHWSLVSFAYLVLIYFLSLQRIVFLIVFPILNTISAMLIYHIVVFDVSVNSALIESVFNTSASEVAGLISWRLILYLVLIIIASLLFALYRFRKIHIKNLLFHLILILIGFGICYTANKVRFKTISHRVPFSIYAAANQYRHNLKLLNSEKIEITSGAKCNADTLTVVLVLGEALRADHVGINGYSRQTTPLLAKENVISFKNIYTKWTHTNQSIPHILTRADSINENLSYTEQSFISIFKKCGFKTYWIGNQEPGNTFVNFILNCDTSIINKPLVTVYNYHKKLDEELLPYFDIFNKQNEPLKLIVLQTIGSHWYYPSHYRDDFEYFKPVIESKTISLEDRGKIINAYDNTVLYTDFFISELINRLKCKNTVLIYLSDHGEVLGEDGKWLHA
ncbi:phosphoethanolamine transferase, partial [Bacteroidota bacterium]